MFNRSSEKSSAFKYLTILYLSIDETKTMATPMKLNGLPTKKFDAKEKSTEEVGKKDLAQPLSFAIKPIHKKALLTLLRFKHNEIVLTYADLSREIGVGEKTKSWQCEAWKQLNKGGCIIRGQDKTVALSQEGTDLAMSLASPDELVEFKAPMNDDDLHDKIRSKLEKNLYNGVGGKNKRHHGKKIFDLFLEDKDKSFLRIELAAKLETNPDSHNFFNGFKALDRMGLITTTGTVSREELVRKWEELNSSSKKPEKQGNEKTATMKEEEDEEQATKQTKKDDGVEKVKKDGKTEDTERPKKKMKKEDVKNEYGKPRKKKVVRVRGGTNLYKLSQKAFFVTKCD